VDGLVAAPSEQLAGTVPEQALGLGIGEGEAALDVGGEQAFPETVGHRLDEGQIALAIALDPQQLVGLRAQLLGLDLPLLRRDLELLGLELELIVRLGEAGALRLEGLDEALTVPTGVDLVVDVVTDPDEAEEAPVAGVERRALVDHPAEDAVVAPHPELHLERA